MPLMGWNISPTSLGNVSGAVQKILNESATSTKNAIAGTKLGSLAVVGIVVLVIIFLVKKVSK